MSFNPEKMINKTVSSMPPSGIRRFFDVAAEMEDCISLGVDRKSTRLNSSHP